MAGNIVIDAHAFKDFSRGLRIISPTIRKKMMTRIAVVGAAGARKMRADLPHPGSGAEKGVRFSQAGRGAMIIIGGNSRPQSYAYAFVVGQKGRGNAYKHPVFGNWSASQATIMPSKPDVFLKNWAEVHDEVAVEIAVAMEEALHEVATASETGA